MFIVLLIFLLHIGAVNYIHGILAISLLTVFVYQPLKKRRCFANALKYLELWDLIFFGITYVLFGEISVLYIEYYLVAPVLAFLTGWIYCECMKNTAEDVKKILLAILIAYGIHVVLNLSINIGSARVAMKDFFQGMRISTGSGVLNTMILSLLMYSILIAKGSERNILLALFAVSFIYSFILGNRTQFVILILVNIVVIILYMHERYGAKGTLKTIYILAGILLALVVVYKLDILGIGTMINKSNFMLRFSANQYTGIAEANTSAEQRMKLLQGSIKQILEKPFGGDIERKYYHNLFLDIARISGIIPMGFMVSYFFRMLKNLFRLFRSDLDVNVRYMLLSVYMGVWLNFMVEPALEGLIEHFLMMCLLDGMVTCVVRYKAPKRLAHRNRRIKIVFRR